MKDYAIISMHEKGFWQVDVYCSMERPPEDGDTPDHFMTCKIGDPKERAIEWCGYHCPHAEILFGDDNEEDEDEDSAIPPSERATEVKP